MNLNRWLGLYESGMPHAASNLRRGRTWLVMTMNSGLAKTRSGYKRATFTSFSAAYRPYRSPVGPMQMSWALCLVTSHAARSATISVP
jgi:hypothetical protein